MFSWWPFLHPHSTTHYWNMAAQLKKVTMKGLHTLQWQTLYFPLVFTVTSTTHSFGHSIVLTKYITNSNTLLSFLTPLLLVYFLLQGFAGFMGMGSWLHEWICWISNHCALFYLQLYHWKWHKRREIFKITLLRLGEDAGRTYWG